MGLLKPKPIQQVANSTNKTNDTQKKHKLKSFAEAGAKFIDDTNEHNINFYAVQAIENCEVDISGCTLLTNPAFEDFDVDFEIPSGCIIYISGSKIQFKTNSKAIVYRRSLQDPHDNWPIV
tara:strand:+ start:412 stop:774 length:363 start_codon:yes stop_codon:yes gene_type:complete